MADLEVEVAGPALRETALELFVSERDARARGRLLTHRRRAWAWALDQNPHQGPHTPSLLWLARMDGRPAGVLLGVPFRGHALGWPIVGHWGVDLYVPPGYRGSGVGAALLRSWRDRSPLALGLGITDSAFRIEIGLGWSPVSLPSRLVRPLSARGALLLKRPPISSRWAPSARAYRHQIRSDLMPVAEAGALYMGLCDRLSAHIDRDPTFLAWRYALPGTGWHWISLWKEGRLEAVSIFRIDRGWLRVKAWLVELLCPPNDPVLAGGLIDATLEAIRRQGADLVEGRFTAGHLRPWLEAAGFMAGAQMDRFIVHPREPADQALRHLEDWHLTLGDSGNG